MHIENYAFFLFFLVELEVSKIIQLDPFFPKAINIWYKSIRPRYNDIRPTYKQMRIYLQSFETTHKRVDSKYIGEEYIYIELRYNKPNETLGVNLWDYL